MLVMAPSDEVELAHMVATAAQIDDRPVCFRYPRGAVASINDAMCYGVPIEVRFSLHSFFIVYVVPCNLINHNTIWRPLAW